MDKIRLLVLLTLVVLSRVAFCQSSTGSPHSPDQVDDILRSNPDVLANARKQIADELRARGYNLTDAQIDELLRRGFGPGHLPPPFSTAKPTNPPAAPPTPAPPRIATATPPNSVPSTPTLQAHISATPWPPPAETRWYASASPRRFTRNVLDDQEHIWMAPHQLRVVDLNWLLPLAGLTAGLINADAEISSRMPKTTPPKNSSISTTFSNMGLYASVAGAGGMFLLGHGRNDPHQKETGILATEAVVNAVLVDESLKIATRRQRPTDGNGHGDFFQGTALNSSFASMHSAITWSIASVVAHEYPGKFTKLMAYGLAGAVSATRVTGRDHFPSDVLVGSVMGYLIGEQVYARHHDRELPGGPWGLHRRGWTETNLPLSRVASPYVPLDSWIYPAFDRLSALGVVRSATIGMKPWTRSECSRLLEEARDVVTTDRNDEASRLYSDLAEEFHTEISDAPTPYAGIDSVYVRTTGISGMPLTDGYHFSRSLINDYGRPFGAGVNEDAGFTSSGSLGMFGFYISGEYEHAPGTPAISQSAQNVINRADFQFSSTGSTPFPVPASPLLGVDRFRLLDTYVTLNLRGYQLSFGRQSLWLGPTTEPFMWSDNAEPIYMFRISQNSPHKLPLLGAYRTEFFVGELSGQNVVDTQNGVFFSGPRSLERQPMVHGEKLTFKPSQNLEFGVGRTALWGGMEFPITANTIRQSYFSASNNQSDQRSFVDFSYRVPGLRNWLTIYNDEFVEDEFSPIGYPRRAAQNSGLYMPQLPGLRRMDLRFEGGYTNVPNLRNESPLGGFFYWNVRYKAGYTNDGNIIGSAIGRWGLVFRGQSTYWFAADRSIQVTYRNVDQGSDFLLGGHLSDIAVRSDWRITKNFSVAGSLQYERWNYPLLSPAGPQDDVAASIQLTYRPHLRAKGGR